MLRDDISGPGLRPCHTTILLLRHAVDDGGVDRAGPHPAGAALSDEGREAAIAWGRRSRWTFDAVIASDASAARDTARLIAGEQGIDDPVITLAGLGARVSDRALLRTFDSLGAIATALPGRRVLAVTHGAVIRTVERSLGVSAPPVPPLEGRWLYAIATPGLPLSPSGDIGVGERTPGRASARLRGRVAIAGAA